MQLLIVTSLVIFWFAAGNPGAPRLLRGSGDRSDEPRRRPGEARAPTPRALDRRWVESRTADILQIQTVAYSANTLSGTVRGKPGDVDDV